MHIHNRTANKRFSVQSANKSIILSTFYHLQLIFIVSKLLKKIGGKGGVHPNAAAENKMGVTLENLADFVLSTEIDTINFYKVLEFISKSGIVNKLQGFNEKYKPSVVLRNKNEEKGVSAFLKLLSAKSKIQSLKEGTSEFKFSFTSFTNTYKQIQIRSLNEFFTLVERKIFSNSKKLHS